MMGNPLAGLGQVYWLVAVVSGAFLIGGAFVLAVGLTRRHARLGDALAVFEGGGRVSSAILADEPTDRGERLGHWVLTRARLTVGERTRQLLALRNRTLTDFAAEKAIMAAMGFAAPSLFAAVSLAVGWPTGWTPLLAAVVAAVVGWFVPDLRLRQGAQQTSSDAGEAVCTFVDLIALERLANQSSTQALHHAASVSQGPLFVALRQALERARLEQRPAWQALEQVGRELGLPQLEDLADVMRLDEQGAALSGVLRARAEELRDAQLMTDKIAAQGVSESLTIWMVIPAMVFGLIFLTPPLLRLVGT